MSSVNTTLLPGIKLFPCNCSVLPIVTSVLPLKVERLGESTVRPIVMIPEIISMMAKRKMSHTGAQPLGCVGGLCGFGLRGVPGRVGEGGIGLLPKGGAWLVGDE